MVLQIFILVNVFFIGILLTLGLQHAMAHFRSDSHEKKTVAPEVKISSGVREKLLHEAEAQFHITIGRSTKLLNEELTKTATQLNDEFEGMAHKAIDEQIKAYRDSLNQMRHLTESSISKAEIEIGGGQSKLKEDLSARKSELEQKMNEAVAARQQEMIAQLDTKLSDSVISFLLETLGHEVDLGSQMPYILKQLDLNKERLSAEIKE